MAALTAAEPIVVAAIAPDSAPNDLDTSLVVTGAGFTCILSGTTVLTPPTVWLNNTLLMQVRWISSTQLTALAPWGLDPGIYTITVTNPGGASGSLTDAFTVTQGIGVWTSDGPYGGNVGTLFLNTELPATVYATVSAAGLFRSPDSGAHWDLLVASAGGQFHAADIAAALEPVLYFHQQGVGLLRSDDGGDHWLVLPFPEPVAMEIRPFTVPSDSQTVYAAVNNYAAGSVYKSQDRGESWIAVTDGLTDTHVTALAFDPVDPQIMFAGTEYGNVFRSDSGGAFWSFTGKPDEFISNLAVNPFGSREPWATGADSFGHGGYLWKYVNRGWVKVLPNAGGNEVAGVTFSRAISGTLWIGAFHASLKSTDGGNSWETIGRSSNTVLVDPADPQVLYLGLPGLGVIRTADSGTTWHEVNEGLTGIFPNGLAISPDDPATVYATSHGAGAFQTANGGGSWTRFPFDELVPRSPLVDPDEPGRVYIARTNTACFTEDDGLTWTCVEPPVPVQYADCCHVEVITLHSGGQPGHLFMGAGFLENDATSFEFVGGGIYSSTDSGASWSFIDVGQAINPVATLAVSTGDPATVFAGTSICCGAPGTGIWKSADSGASWQLAGLSDRSIAGIVIDPANPQIVYAVSDREFYVSQDAGVTWTLRSLLGIDASGLLAAPASRPVLYVYGWQGVIRSSNGGVSWERAAGLLGYSNIAVMAATRTEDRVFLYAGAGGSIVMEMESSLPAVASADETAMAAGVYRNAARLLTLRAYLPVVQR